MHSHVMCKPIQAKLWFLGLPYVESHLSPLLETWREGGKVAES